MIQGLLLEKTIRRMNSDWYRCLYNIKEHDLTIKNFFKDF